MASGSVDGDSVTITTLAGTATTGSVLATREFLPGEVVENANYVTMTVATNQDILFAILDTSDNIANSAIITANSTETISFNVGVSIAEYKLAVLNNYMFSEAGIVTPATVSVSNVTTQYIEPQPVENFWTVNPSVTSFLVDGGKIIVLAYDGAAYTTMATHTEEATGTNLTVTLTGGPTGVNVFVTDLTTDTVIGTSSDISETSTITGTVAVGDSIEIKLASTEATSTSLPYNLTAETSYS